MTILNFKTRGKLDIQTTELLAVLTSLLSQEHQKKSISFFLGIEPGRNGM
jgi:hypothetical protein